MFGIVHIGSSTRSCSYNWNNYSNGAGGDQSVFQGKWFDEVAVGDRFGTSVTVTETHLVLGAGLFGDFNPLHVDEEFAKKSRFGTRILHGPFTSALVSAPIGMYFSGSAIAYLEHSCRFKAAVLAQREVRA